MSEKQSDGKKEQQKETKNKRTLSLLKDYILVLKTVSTMT